MVRLQNPHVRGVKLQKLLVTSQNVLNTPPEVT